MRPTSATVSDTFSSVLCRISRIVLWKSSRKHVVSQSPDVDSSLALIYVISGQINFFVRYDTTGNLCSSREA